jgi:hypothetical protein
LHVPGQQPPLGGRRTSKRVLAGSILPIITIVLIAIGLMTTQWYVLSDEATLEWFGVTTEMEIDLEYGLDEGEYYIATTVDGEKDTMEGEIDYADVDDPDEAKYIDYARTTKMLMIVGIVLTATFIAFGIVAGLGLLSRMGAVGRFLPMVVGLVAFAVLLIGLLYFSSNFGGQVEEDYDYAYGKMPGTAHVGGSWYFALVGAILMLVGSLLTVGPRATTGEAVPPPGTQTV